jgi:hypothetical protein
MQIPVDTSMLRFTVVGAREPACRRQRTPAETDTRTPAGQHGKRWRVRLRVAGEGFNQIVRVSVPGNPRLQPGTPATVDGLALVTWRRAGGDGYALRAIAVKPHVDAAAPGRA